MAVSATTSKADALQASDTTESVTIRFDASLKNSVHHDDASATIGYVLTDEHGEHLIEQSLRISYWVSSTHMEFDALLAALEKARVFGFSHVDICGDSKAVIDLVDLNTPTSSNASVTQKYIRKVRATLLWEFDSYTLNYLPRDENQHADRLADEGHDIHARFPAPVPKGT